MLPLFKTIDENKKLPSFSLIGKKMLILHWNLEFLMAGDNFPLNEGIFYQWVKKMAIFCFDQRQSQW